MENIKPYIKYSLIGLIIGTFLISFVYSAKRYSAAINLFGLQKVVVYGAASVDAEAVISRADVTSGTSLFSLPLDSIQSRVLEEPNILTARVSRELPRTLKIQVKEREPIALINHGKISCVDADGFIMDLPSKSLGSALPILSGFSAEDDIQVNAKTTNAKINNMLMVLNEIRQSDAFFFPQISELVSNGENEYILYTADSATRIYLGEEDFIEKVHLLEAFWATLQDRREWDDFEYIDLRYHKQVIVQERT